MSSNDQIDIIINDIASEFNKLNLFLLKQYNQKDTTDIKRLNNLYRGFRAWLKSPQKSPFVHPIKIDDHKAKIRGVALPGAFLNSIAKSVSNLKYDLHEAPDSYFKSEENIIKFYIESAQKKGMYRLKIEINGKDFVDILRESKEQQIISETTISNKIEKDNLISEYLRKIAKDHRYLDTYGIPFIGIPDSSIELNRTYIELKAIEEVPMSEAIFLTDHIKDLSGIPEHYIWEKQIVKKQTTPISIKRLLERGFDDIASRHMVILGAPGSGKTTLLRHIAYSIASRNKEWENFWDYTPIFIDLGYYEDPTKKDLRDYILDSSISEFPKLKKDNIRQIFDNSLEQCTNEDDGGVILLIDALDEIKNSEKLIIQKINQFRNQHEKAFIIITSRIKQYYKSYSLRGFKLYLIEDLQNDQIKGFIKSWFEVIGESKSVLTAGSAFENWAIERTKSLIQKIEQIPSVNRIVSTPLHLIFLVLISTDPDVEIPQTRVQLYQKYFDKLLLTWEQKHDPQLSYKKPLLEDGFHEISWIIYIALFGNIKEEPTKRFIAETIRKNTNFEIEKIDNILDFWINSGIFITVKTHSGLELILPRHLSFLEYGFGCKLSKLWDQVETRENLWKDIRKNLHSSHFIEPLLIFAGMIKEPSIFFERVLKLKDDIFHHNLFLSAEAAIEIRNKLIYSEIYKTIKTRIHKNYEMYKLKKMSFLFDKTIDCIVRLFSLADLVQFYMDEKHRSYLISSIVYNKNSSTLLLLKKLIRVEKEWTVKTELIEFVCELEDKKTATGLLTSLYYEETITERKIYIANAICHFGDIQQCIPIFEELINIEKHLPNDKKQLIGTFISVMISKVKSGQTVDFILIELFKRSIHSEDNKIEKSEITCSCEKTPSRDAISILRIIYEDKNIPKAYLSDLFYIILFYIKKCGDKTDIPFLKKAFLDNDGDLTEILRCIDRIGGKHLSLSLIKESFSYIIDPYHRAEIILLANKAGFKELAISFLEQLYYAKDSYNRNDIVEAIGFDLSQLANPFLRRIYLEEHDANKRMEILRDMLAINIKRQYSEENSIEDTIEGFFAVSNKHTPLPPINDQKEVVSYFKEMYDVEKNFGLRCLLVELLDYYDWKYLPDETYNMMENFLIKQDKKAYLKELLRLYQIESLSIFKISILKRIINIEKNITKINLKDIYGGEKNKFYRSIIISIVADQNNQQVINILHQFFKLEPDLSMKLDLIFHIYSMGNSKLSARMIKKIMLNYEEDEDEIIWHISVIKNKLFSKLINELGTKKTENTENLIVLSSEVNMLFYFEEICRNGYAEFPKNIKLPADRILDLIKFVINSEKDEYKISFRLRELYEEAEKHRYLIAEDNKGNWKRIDIQKNISMPNITKHQKHLYSLKTHPNPFLSAR